VEGDDITVDVSSPSTFIQSHDNSLPVAVSSADTMNSSAVTIAGIQSSEVLMSDTAHLAMASNLALSSPAALTVDSNSSHDLPSLETAPSS